MLTPDLNVKTFEQGKDTNIKILSQVDPAGFGAIDGLKEVNPNDIIWQQNDIGAGIILFGLFEFKAGIDKKTKKPYCHIQGVSKLNILELVKIAGFRKRYLKDSNFYLMVHVENHIIEEITIDLIRVKVFNELDRINEITIHFEDHKFTFNKDLLLTIYLKNQDQIFNKNFLELMHPFDVLELSDGRKISYMLFSNCIVEITADSSSIIPYDKLKVLDRCVWKSHILRREYRIHKTPKNSEVFKFISNVSGGNQQRILAFISAIGYLLHCYNGSHMGQAIVCYDETPTDSRNPQGGTGKGLFAQMISYMREMAKIDGKHFKADDKFRFSSVNLTTDVAFVDDLNKDVPFECFFSCLTDGFTIERKHLDSIKLSPEDSPKMLFSMNTVISSNGSSHRRRMFILEFSDYYSKQIKTGSEHPIEDEHGVFFDRINWSSDNWDAYTQFMIDCLQYYLKYDLQPYELINVGKNALIQSTGEDFQKWVESKNFQVGIYYETKPLYINYKYPIYGDDEKTFPQKSFSNLLKKYASIQGWKIDFDTNQATKASRFIFNPKN